jgi:hypothetical protein
LTTPFTGRSILELANTIVSGEFELKPSKSISYSDDISRCISSLLIADMSNRPSISRVLRFLGDSRIASSSIDITPRIAADILSIKKDRANKGSHDSDTEDEDEPINPAEENSSYSKEIDHKASLAEKPMPDDQVRAVKTSFPEAKREAASTIIILHKDKGLISLDKQYSNSYTLDDTKLRHLLRRDQTKLQRLQSTGEYFISAKSSEDGSIPTQTHRLQSRINVWSAVLLNGSKELSPEESQSLELETIINGEKMTPRPQSAVSIQSTDTTAISEQRQLLQLKQMKSIDIYGRRSAVNSTDKSSDYELDSWTTRRSSASAHATTNDRLFLNTRQSRATMPSTPAESQLSTRTLPSFAMNQKR